MIGGEAGDGYEGLCSVKLFKNGGADMTKSVVLVKVAIPLQKQDEKEGSKKEDFFAV